jgi:hypothetical protein
MEGTKIFREIIFDYKHGGSYTNHRNLKEFTNIYIA